MLIDFDYFIILWTKAMDNIFNMVIIISEEDEIIIIRRRLQDRHNSYNPKKFPLLLKNKHSTDISATIQQ